MTLASPCWGLVASAGRRRGAWRAGAWASSTSPTGRRWPRRTFAVTSAACADLDRAKPLAVAEFLQDRFPEPNIHHAEFDFREQPDQLRDLLAGAEIVLVAIDSEGPKHLIDAMLWELGRPAVYLGVYGGGWAAEAILVDPSSSTPCYGCAALRLGRTGIEVDPPASGSSYALPVRLRSHEGDKPAWSQADLGSILPVTALGVRIATAWLEARRGFERPLREFQRHQATAWRFAMRRVPAWGIGPWELDFIPIRRRADCLLCGTGRDLATPEQFLDLLHDDLHDQSAPEP